MEKKTKQKLAKGIIATGVGLTGVALKEYLLSKEEHDRKESEIIKVEKEKDKYMKKIGKYEPFDMFHIIYLLDLLLFYYILNYKKYNHHLFLINYLQKL
jgi:hypothetical protein